MTLLTDQNHMGHIFYTWLSVSGFLPQNKPAIFSAHEWRNLTSLSAQKNLIKPLFTSPLTIELPEKLALYYYVLARYGNDIANLATFSEELQLKHHRWWQKSKIFAPVESKISLETTPVPNTVFQSFTIDPTIASHPFFADKPISFLVSATKSFLEKYVFVAFEKSDVETIWRAGTKGRSFKLHQPIAEIWQRAVQIFPLELHRARQFTLSNSSELEYIIQSTHTMEPPKPTLSARIENVHLNDQFNNITSAARMFAICGVFSGTLPAIKPIGVSEENWTQCKNVKSDDIYLDVLPNGRLSYKAPVLFDLLTTTVSRRSDRFYRFYPPYFPEHHWWCELSVISPVKTRHLKQSQYTEREFPVHARVSMHPRFRQLNSNSKKSIILTLFTETLKLAYREDQFKKWEIDRMRHATKTHPKQIHSLMVAYEQTAQKIAEELTRHQINESLSS